MLKYSPKRFWGLLKGKDRCPPLDLASFAKFNERLFHDPTIPDAMFTPL